MKALARILLTPLFAVAFVLYVLGHAGAGH
jgi:hypothetical protein